MIVYIGCPTGRACHGAVFEDGKRIPAISGNQGLQRLEHGIGDDARSDCNAQSPAGFQANIEIRYGHHSADEHPRYDRADRNLPHAVAAIDVFDPPAVGRFDVWLV